MDDLIEALQIFRKYTNTDYPTGCMHDQLYVDVNPDLVSGEDIERLDELGFIPDEEYGEGFISFRYGSC